MAGLGAAVSDSDGIAESSTPTSDLGALIEGALRETDRRLGAGPEAAGADPVLAMLTSIRRQLQFMAAVVAAGPTPTVEQANGLTLGVIAVREFEADDPAYCDLLCEAAFRFKCLATGPV